MPSPLYRLRQKDFAPTLPQPRKNHLTLVVNKQGIFRQVPVYVEKNILPDSSIGPEKKQTGVMAGFYGPFRNPFGR
jgi:hypothetical protein